LQLGRRLCRRGLECGRGVILKMLVNGLRARWLACGVLVSAIAVVAVLAGGAVAKPGSNHGKGLGKGDLALVAQAEASGQATVPLLVATGSNSASAVASKLAGLGAEITTKNDRFGYLVA